MKKDSLKITRKMSVIFDEESESLTLNMESLSWLIDQLHSIIEPEVLYDPDPVKATEEALSRSRLRARDILALLADSFPIDHGLMESAGGSFTVLNHYLSEPAINRDWPGRDSNNYRAIAQRKLDKMRGRNG